MTPNKDIPIPSPASPTFRPKDNDDTPRSISDIQKYLNSQLKPEEIQSLNKIISHRHKKIQSTTAIEREEEHLTNHSHDLILNSIYLGNRSCFESLANNELPEFQPQVLISVNGQLNEIPKLDSQGQRIQKQHFKTKENEFDKSGNPIWIKVIDKNNPASPLKDLTNTSLQHLQLPIVEEDVSYDQVFPLDKPLPQQLLKIFQAFDRAIISNQKTLIHCRQGEHRSATILIIYLAIRFSVTFEESWNFVHSKRPALKPFTDKRKTLMTTAYEWFQINK